MGFAMKSLLEQLHGWRIAQRGWHDARSASVPWRRAERFAAVLWPSVAAETPVGERRRGLVRLTLSWTHHTDTAGSVSERPRDGVSRKVAALRVGSVTRSDAGGLSGPG